MKRLFTLVALLSCGAVNAAFPTVEDVTTSVDASTTSHTIELPATVNEDDLLVIFFSCGNGNCADANDPSGFTRLHSANYQGSGEFSVWGKKAVGDEDGTTADITAGTADVSVHHVYRISGWEADTVTNGFECASSVDGSGLSPDPPSLTPSWGAKDTLWLEAVAATEDDETVTAASTNYTDLASTISGAGVDLGATIGSARRELNAVSDDPDAMTLDNFEAFSVITCAVEPAESDGPCIACIQYYYDMLES